MIAARRTTLRRRLHLALACGLTLSAGLLGCQAPGSASPADCNQAISARHMQRFGNADLPRRIGTVENVGLQLPAVSPDGHQLLYLRTDQDALSPLTLLGAADPQATPPSGTLEVWIRPIDGATAGRCLSTERWAHSATWSPTGGAVAYVACEPPESYIVHVDLQTGRTTRLGVPGSINCLPSFDGGDGTLLFCVGTSSAGPFRVFRQSVGDAHPEALSPDGADCVLPVASDGGGAVLCAQVEGQHLNWVRSSTAGQTVVAPEWGASARPDLLQVWAGIAAPLSPDRRAVLYYDTTRERISILHVPDRLVRWHRRGSIAACWIDNETIALATPDGAFVVNTGTGASVSLFSGQWIPVRYVPAEQRLILLGQDTRRRFAIWQVDFNPQVGVKP